MKYKAWQILSIFILKAFMHKVIKVLHKRLDRDVFEKSQGVYWNVWFFMEKKDGGLRLINSAIYINKEIIRNAFIPLSAKEYLKDFGMYKFLSLLDFFNGYNQVPLNPKSQDLTIFAISIGLLRMCIFF